jgi:L-amino acid N-acyltransferase YncA
MITIRPASRDDWAGIWPFYRRIVQAQETYAYDPALSSGDAADNWFRDPPGATVVAVDHESTADQRIVGSATMGPNRPGPGRHIGTASFMVDPDSHGSGIGRRLAEYVIDWHRRNDYHGIQFNAVVETNEAAVRLWQSLGFTIIGTVPEAYEHARFGLVGLHVMYLPLR